MPWSYIDVPGTNPAFNLALEQYVFDSLSRNQNWFLLWQNHNTIVIGRHQNTLAEINESAVRERAVTVVRRLSGGGAVQEAEMTRVAGCPIVSLPHMHWYRSLSMHVSSIGANMTCSLRIFTSSLFGTSSPSLALDAPLPLVLGAIVADRGRGSRRW